MCRNGRLQRIESRVEVGMEGGGGCAQDEHADSGVFFSSSNARVANDRTADVGRRRKDLQGEDRYQNSMKNGAKGPADGRLHIEQRKCVAVRI